MDFVLDFKKTEAFSLITEFIHKINNSIKSEKQLPLDENHIIFKIKGIINSTPLSEVKGRFANPAMVKVIEEIEKVGEKMAWNTYLKNSFGNKIRMDFGTGHELNFLCYLYCCIKECEKGNDDDGVVKECEKRDAIGVAKENAKSKKVNASYLTTGELEESTVNLENNLELIEETNINLKEKEEKKEENNLKEKEEKEKSILKLNLKEDEDKDLKFTTPICHINQISAVLREYFSTVRLFISKFNVEPAGSRGCWSIDDYLLLPYLFGSAENFTNPLPIDCIGKGMFRDAYNSNNSMMLRDLCKLSWSSINAGLYRMYVEEVLGRRVVTQHFIYSEYLPDKER